MPSISEKKVDMKKKRMACLILIGLIIGEMFLGVNSGTIPTYCMFFQPVQGDAYVHYGSIAHRPILCKAASSIVHFFPVKPIKSVIWEIPTFV